MSEKNARRKKTIVNVPVQMGMLVQTVTHWVSFVLLAFALLALWQFMLGGPDGTLMSCLEQTWKRHGAAFLVLIALLPVVIHDSMKLSHRIAGPIFRLHGAIRQLADGESIRPVKFRKKDYWHDVAEDFNRLADRFGALSLGGQATAEATADESEALAEEAEAKEAELLNA